MSRRPDLVLKALDKKSGKRSGKLGVAWTNDNGSINIVLDPWTKLEYDPDMVLTLFKNDRPNTPYQDAIEAEFSDPGFGSIHE